MEKGFIANDNYRLKYFVESYIEYKEKGCVKYKRKL